MCSPSIRRSSRLKNEDDPQPSERAAGLTKSVVKRKRTVEREEHEVDFTFTPTHPDKKKARVSASKEDEPPATRSTRPTSTRKKVAAAEASKTATSSRSLRSQVEVGVSTKIPSKASQEETPKPVTKKTETSNASVRPHRTSVPPKTPESSPSKKRKTPSIDNSDDITETEARSPKKPKTAKQVSPASSTPPKPKSAPPTATDKPSKGELEVAEERQSPLVKSTVTLEENPISYWDFVKKKRGDALIKRMVKESPDGTRRLGQEEEETLRVVQNRFFAEADALYRPEDVYIPNPVNEELEVVQEYYQRIIDLLEKENEDLESSHHRVVSQLASLGVSPPSSSSSSSFESLSQVQKATPSKASSGGGGRRKSLASAVPLSAKRTQGRRSMVGVSAEEKALVETTNAEVAEIMLHMPPVETLLSEEEMNFLAERPALASNLQLSAFSRLQTKLDSLQLLIKQMGYVNSTFEEKAIGISGAMRSYMVPSAATGAPINLSRVPVSSPLMRK